MNYYHDGIPGMSSMHIMNGMSPFDMQYQVYAQYFLPQQAPSTETKFNGLAKIFVGNIGSTASEQELRMACTQYGEVGDIYIKHSSSRAWAIVQMDYTRNARNAIEDLNGIVIGGQPVLVRPCAHRYSLWVGNIGTGVSNEILYQAFSKFGDVERAVVASSERGEPLGWGFVYFARKPAYDRAIEVCKSKPFMINSLPIPVKIEPALQPETLMGVPHHIMKTGVHTLHQKLKYPAHSVDDLTDQGQIEIALEWFELLKEEEEEKAKLKEKFGKKKDALTKKMEAYMTCYVQSENLSEDRLHNQAPILKPSNSTYQPQKRSMKMPFSQPQPPFIPLDRMAMVGMNGYPPYGGESSEMPPIDSTAGSSSMTVPDSPIDGSPERQDQSGSVSMQTNDSDF
eukprot:Clim_evm176s157 gene=Clim_evmTU176s157